MSMWRFLHTFERRQRTAPPCGCLFLLELAFSDDEAATIQLTDPAWANYGEVRLAGHQMDFCPRCGGRMGRYRPELIEAVRAFQAARERYAALKGSRDFDEFEVRCAGFGLLPEEAGGGYAREVTDPAHSIHIVASWDPDHERVYTELRFSPPESLRRAPFVEG